MILVRKIRSVQFIIVDYLGVKEWREVTDYLNNIVLINYNDNFNKIKMDNCKNVKDMFRLAISSIFYREKERSDFTSFLKEKEKWNV